MLKNLSILLVFTCLASCNNMQNADNTTEAQEIKANFRLVNYLPISLKESSGLCFTDGNLWTINDGGNSNLLYRIDSTSGEVLQVLNLKKEANTDWEDIAADNENIYVGDFGNNEGNREDLNILIIKKSDIDFSIYNQKIKTKSIKFKYPGQKKFKKDANTNFDCEAFIALGSNLYLFTKRHDDLKTDCYSLPKAQGKYKAKLISSFDTKGKITAAAYNPKTKVLALGGYMNQKVEPFIWLFKDFKGVNFFDGQSQRIEFESDKKVLQFEGLDFRDNKSLFVSCESVQGPAGLYLVEL